MYKEKSNTKQLEYKQYRVMYIVYPVQNRYAANATIPLQIQSMNIEKNIELARDYLMYDQAEAAIILAAKAWIDDFIESFSA